MKTITNLKFILLLLFSSQSYSQEACWKQTSAGQQHTLALRNDGTIWAWGSNFHLVLGTGTGLDSHIPIQVGTDNDWKQIKTGDDNLAIKENGTLWAWGANDIGQFGNGTEIGSAIPIQIGIENDWKEIYANGSHSAGLKNDGTLWVWGLYTSNFPTKIDNTTDWKKASVGWFHSLAIKNDGTLWTWGISNQYGQMGIPGITGSSTPLQVNSSTWKDVDRGILFTIAIKSDGTLWGWGDLSIDNHLGGTLLGNGIPGGSNIPIQIGIENNWKKVKCGYHFTMAIKENGTLWSWGLNQYGELGDGTTISKNIPVQVGTDTDWKELGNNNYYHTTAIKNDGSLWSWGRNFLGALGDGTLIDSNVPILVECATLGTKENNFQPKFSIYPNPSTALISIKNPENAVINQIIIHDFLGKTVLETHSINEFIDITKLSSGMYILNIYSEGKISREKFLKL